MSSFSKSLRFPKAEPWSQSADCETLWRHKNAGKVNFCRMAKRGKPSSGVFLPEHYAALILLRRLFTLVGVPELFLHKKSSKRVLQGVCPLQTIPLFCAYSFFTTSTLMKYKFKTIPSACDKKFKAPRFLLERQLQFSWKVIAERHLAVRWLYFEICNRTQNNLLKSKATRGMTERGVPFRRPLGLSVVRKHE